MNKQEKIQWFIWMAVGMAILAFGVDWTFQAAGGAVLLIGFIWLFRANRPEDKRVNE